MSHDKSGMVDSSLTRSRIYQALSQARASLAEPTRPVTPSEHARHLFSRQPSGDSGGLYEQRPSSAFRIGASHFLAPPTPRRELGAGAVSSQPEILDLNDQMGATSLGRGAPFRANEQLSAQVDAQAQWWAEVDALLKRLSPQASLEPLCEICDALWQMLRTPGGSSGRLAGPPGAAPIAADELGRRRRAVVRAAGALVDRKESGLLLRLCRLILLADDNDGFGQPHAVHLLFKLSKAEANDSLFHELGLLPRLLQLLAAAPHRIATESSGAVVVVPEVALYAAGALKFLSSSSSNTKALAKLGAVGSLTAVLRWQLGVLRAAASNEGAAWARGCQLLLLLTVALRNLSLGGTREQFISSGCVEELCTLMEVTPQHAELCLNASRVLAKLSLDAEVREVIDSEPRHLQTMRHVLHLHFAELPLLVRLCFIFGNLSATSSHDRSALQPSTPLLLQQLRQHTVAFTAQRGGANAAAAAALAVSSVPDSLEPLPEDGAPAAGAPAAEPEPRSRPSSRASSSSHSSSHSSSRPSSSRSARPRSARPQSARRGGRAEAAAPSECERVEVLVKLVRLLAHLAISPEAGLAIAATPEALALLELLEALQQEGGSVPGEGSPDGARGEASALVREELLLNTVSAITNLSYYRHSDNQLLQSQEQLCRLLVPVLMHPNEEGQVEAARALGNLSRLPEARLTIVERRVHEALLLLLEHPSPLVPEAVCGALINLAADGACRAPLLAAGAAERLAEALRSLLAHAAQGSRPAEAATVLAGKTLCNLLCAGEGECPLGRSRARLLEAIASEEANEALAAGWDDAEARREWPQVACLLAQLIGSRPPAAHDDGLHNGLHLYDDAAEGSGHCSEGGGHHSSASSDSLEELPAPPTVQTHDFGC